MSWQHEEGTLLGYGKLAYTNVGPFEVVAVHPRNPDVYELKNLEHPDKDPTRHHVRELCPYITKEAHEKQTGNDEVNAALSELDPKVGDFLLLPYGQTDYVVQVVSAAHGQIKVQYLNKTNRKDNPCSNLRLSWYKQLPSSNAFDDAATDQFEEIFQDKLTNKQVAEGWLPYTDTISIDEFYQKPIEDKDIKKTKDGWTLNKIKRTLIRKHKPFHQR